MNEESSTKEAKGLEALFEPFTLARLDSLECEVRKTKKYQDNQARKAETYKQLAEATPEKMHADLQRFAQLWEDMTHYHFSYCYRRGFDDGVLFLSRILDIKIGDLCKRMEQQAGADSHPMRESLYSHHGLFSILDGEDFFTSTNASDREMNFWEFIKDCVQERVNLIGSEGLDERKYKELDEEIMALALRLEEALPKDKVELVDKYNNLIVGEESEEEDFFYCQGFMDAVRMLWGFEVKVGLRLE